MFSALRSRSFVWTCVVFFAAAITIPRPASAQLSVGVGDLFPDFSALDQNSSPFTLSAHRGKVVLLHICTMWCGPCWASADDEQLISNFIDEAIGAENWLFVDALVEDISGGPTTQTNANQWINAFDTPAVTLHSDGDAGAELHQLPSSIGVTSFPAYFVIAADGRVSAIHSGYIPTTSTQSLDHDAAVLFQLVVEAAATPGMLIDALTNQVEAAVLPNGISRGLLAHLANAAKVLGDDNPANEGASVGSLRAFISQVHALAGKQLPESDATDLIVGAEKVIALLTG